MSAIILSALCAESGIPRPVAEYRFHDSRKLRFDFAWPEHRVALEIEGGVWTGGRHTRGSGFVGDLEKYSEAAALGWRIIRVQPSELLTNKTTDIIRRAINWRAAA